MYDTVFQRAQNKARQLKQGKKVAVLCMSAEQFAVYEKAGKYKDTMLVIASRSLIESVEHAGKRFIFSMPEYVAGLQFEAVYLIEANENDVATTGTGVAARRRFVSNIYLGASRAQRLLEIYTNSSRGGMVVELAKAIQSGSVDRIAPEQSSLRDVG
jgi:hypothetical protein